MLEIKELCVAYGDRVVLENLSFTLNDSEIITLVGPTGCGKSSLLQALAGLIPIQAGSIQQEHWQVTVKDHLPPERRNIGMVFQDFALFPHLSVRDNVTFKLKDPAIGDHWINMLGLSELRDAKPGRLSGGQKQRVALARAIAHEPNLILLDEPLSSLDAALKDSLRWDIKNALKEAQIPAIWVTHDQAEALSVGDRIGVLEGGQLQQLDTPETVYQEPVNTFVGRFLGAANFVRGCAKPEGAVLTQEFGTIRTGQGFTEDQMVQVLVRPENLKVIAGSESPNAIVQTVRFEGAHWSCDVCCDGGEILHVHNREALNVGSRVELQLIEQPLWTCFPA